MKKNIARLVCGVFACCLMLCVCAELLDVSGAGTVDDPLITYSYVQNKVLPALKEKISSSTSKLLAVGRDGSLKSAGNAAAEKLSLAAIADRIAGELTSGVAELSIPSVTGQRKVTLNSRWAAVARPGATVTVLSGGVRAVPEASGSVIVVGKKTELAGEAELAPGEYAVVSEKGDVIFYASGEAVVTVTGQVSFKTPISGSVAIEGTPEFGQKLVPDVGKASLAGDISYVWTVDGETVSSEAEYTVAEKDIGKSLVLTVSASGKGCGRLVSPPVTLAKTSEDAPDAPTAKSVTYDTVTLTAVEGMEYRLGTGEWQTSPVFSGLKENTEYRFFMRRAETGTSSASAPSGALAVKTAIQAALTSSVYKVDAENSRMSGIAPGTSAEALCKGMDYPAYVKIYDASGKEVSGETAVGTGWKLALVVDGKERSSVSLVVTGDVNGDGKATLTDFVNMKSHLLGTKLTGLKLLAGDLNGDGSFTLTDFVNMKSYLLGTAKINGQKV